MSALFRDPPTSDPAGRRRTRPLLAVDPELGSRLAPERREAADRVLRVPLATIPRGAWRAAAALGDVGLLVLEGVVAREIVLDDQVSSELLGAGDVIAPWAGSPERGSAGEEVRWHVLATLQVALLDCRLTGRLAVFPELHTALLERALAQSERLAALKAFSQLNSVERRLTALFRHLADRWGRVTPRGIVVPLALSHRLLGELIGARRPTVTVAVNALARAGTLTRTPDGAWLLPLDAAAEVDELPSRVVEHRRDLLVGERVRRSAAG